MCHLSGTPPATVGEVCTLAGSRLMGPTRVSSCHRLGVRVVYEGDAGASGGAAGAAGGGARVLVAV